MTFAELMASSAMQVVNIILALMAVALVWRFTTPAGSRKLKARKTRNYILVAASIYISGVILYAIGFNHEGSWHNYVALITRSMLSSIEMFVSHSDLIEVSEKCKGNPFYMAAFSLTHFLAVFINISILFNYIGFQLSSVRRVGQWMKAKKGENLHIFVGTGEATNTLSADIRKNEPDAWIVWVPLYEKKENEKQHMSIGGLFSQISYRRELVLEADELGAVLARPNTSLKDSFGTDNQDYKMHELGLDKTNRLISKALSVYVYILSDDIEQNIAQTQILCRLKLHRPVKIFCHACRNALNLSLETQYGLRQEGSIAPEVSLIDSAYMSTLQMMASKDTSPVNFVDINRDGTVSSEFHSLIIGFGHYGNEALKFLYEYAAFVSPDGKRSPFKCTVIDSEMSNRSGIFYLHSPALKSNPDISLVEATAGSREFWDAVMQNIDTLDYAIIAMNDDILNLNTGISIYEQAIRRRNGRKLSIFIRCYSAAHEEYVRSVIDFYNARNQNSSCRLELFGRKGDIFRYDMLFNSFLREGMDLFYESYMKSIGSHTELDLSSIKRGDANLGEIYAIRRHYGMLIAHCLHIMSNLRLAGLYGNDTFDKNIIERLLTLASGMKERTLSDEDKKVVGHIAHTEFLRWRSRMEFDGYVLKTDGGARCSDMERKHKCLTEWDRLPLLPASDDEQGEVNYQDYFYFCVGIGFEVAAKLIENKRL